MENTFNFTVGKRYAGKTFNTKKELIERFLKTGEQFVYVYRAKEPKRIQAYFDGISAKFPDHEFKVYGKGLYIDGKLAGYAISNIMIQGFENGAGADIWLRKAVKRIIFLCQRRNLDLLFYAKEENPHDLGNANEIRTILGEYVTLFKHIDLNLEFVVDSKTTCYNAFSIIDAKTGEIIFECNELETFLSG